MFTPTIVGMPHCIDFYYYDLTRDNDTILWLKNSLRYLLGVSIKHSHGENEDRLIFEFHGMKRTIYWVHKDNRDFLDRKVHPAFYFHRGDSWGEGGSGQKWDSELMPLLLKKVSAGNQLRILTDGEPGGISPHLKALLHELPSQSKRGAKNNRSYYLGVLNFQDIDLLMRELNSS